MNIKKMISALLLLAVGTTATLFAQTAVTVGSQVTDESNIVSGKAYILQSQAAGGNTTVPYINDNGTNYAIPNGNACNESSVYYLISNGDGTWKIKNYYTNHYWGVPVYNQAIASVADEASAGTWSLNFSGGTAYPSAPDAGSTVRGLDRSSQKLWGYTTGTGVTKQVKIYEVALSNTPLSEFTGKDLQVNSTSANTVEVGKWYVMFDRGANHGYLYENISSHTLYNTNTVPDGYAPDNAKYLVRLISGSGDKYYIQDGFGNFFGKFTQSTPVPTTGIKQELITVNKISSTDAHYYLQSSNNVILDANATTNGDATVVGWGTSIPTSAGGNNDWAFFPVEFVEAWNPAINEVYTINNTNTSRGAMMYNGSSSYVWSSGKSGTFSATDPNCQWVLVPTGTTKQYYLYNVGAGKFAIPSGTASIASWIFSADAVAVTFITQGDGTKKIKTVTTDTYAAVSNGYDGPIINYNDVGGNFTITKVDGDQSTAAMAAVNKLVDNVTALTAIPNDGTSDWYVIRIKSHASYADKYIFPVDPEITYNGTNYPLSFDHGANIRPAINDANYYTCITREGNMVYWQMPNGKYLYGANNKFPVSTLEKSAFSMDYTSGSGIRMWGGSRYAVPYLLGNQYFIGETGSSGNAYYDVYPINLSAAGLEAWKVLCDNAPDNAQITCSRSDVSGLTSVYKNGYFFLPADVTPASSDFTLDGASGVTIDAMSKTITLAYDPNLAIVADGVSVAQGWQTAGRDSEVMLLSVNVAPFRAATGVTMTVSLKDGSEANISSLKLYEANSASPEIYSTGTGAPTKTEIATATISGSAATFSIGNLSVGTHYYWIGATVKSDATLGAVIDAAVTGITYTCNENETTLDLISVGDPSDRGAMVFNTRSYPFLPRDNGSRVYRIPAMVVANDGSIVTAVDKRYGSHTDIGVPAGHIIDIVVRRSTDGGKTWGDPVIIAKGQGTSNTDYAGFGDPSLIKGSDGKIYCFFAAGNLGYFNGLNKICMSTSSDNGVTWDSNEATLPLDLVTSGKVTDHASSYGSNTCYGLYDYFVTSGRGLCTSEGYLMALLPAEVYTTSEKSSSAKNGNHDYIFYSTDKGATWHISENAIFVGGDEAKIIQANDGSLLASVRQGGNRGFNTATYTLNNDGTLTFTMGTQWNNSQLNAGGYANNQDIFYYQRETDEGKTDIIFHSMTTGQHANLKLYYSTDKGRNWTEFLNVQTKGTRYVTMEKSASGSLYLLFEDQSLTSAGGYTDYNHYPINFLEITRDQLVSLIPELDHLVISTEEVKIAYDNVAPSTYGDWTILGGVWRQGGTSSDASGVADLSLQSTYTGAFNQAQNIYSKYVLALKVSATNAIDQITLTAPDGYAIKGYSLNARSYNGGKDYTLSSGETSLTTVYSEWRTFSVSNIYAKSTSFSITTGQEQTNYLCVSDFIVTLVPLTDYTRSTNEGNFGTICLPYDVISYTGAKFYKVAGKMMDGDALSYITLEEVAEPKGGVGYLFQAEGAELTAYYVETGVLAEIENPTSTGLVGSYESQFIPQGGYMLKNNKVYYVDKENYAKVGVNRAYIDLSNIGEADESQAKLVRLVNGDLATGVSRVQTEVADEAVFNLAGQRVSKTTKGVYIINGKKVAVK
ncbi:MAG: exo-alpha-sialidase [Bacteroidaceae bacterium]|nr:exo-alpha-sialidase [Bacteroidaceae bacterium]